MFLDLICSLEPENFRKNPGFSSFLSDFVIAKSDLKYINSLPVTMVTEMQYPDVYKYFDCDGFLCSFQDRYRHKSR